MQPILVNRLEKCYWNWITSLKFARSQNLQRVEEWNEFQFEFTIERLSLSSSDRNSLSSRNKYLYRRLFCIMVFYSGSNDLIKLTWISRTVSNAVFPFKFKDFINCSRAPLESYLHDIIDLGSKNVFAIVHFFAKRFKTYNTQTTQKPTIVENTEERGDR